MIALSTEYDDGIELPVPCWFVISGGFLLGGAYVMAFPGKLVRARLRREYGEYWENYVDVSKAKVFGCFCGGLTMFVLGIVGVVVSWNSMAAPVEQ